uniref:Zn(2)-C6 fungal-type domain-containing protein n=1 Tax=Ganoderma boninense TaxID=34458 RepID=A0A5K1JY47_9APHY|nr:Zn(2)-C6 fungal-type domain-containing protein [Ganoderma boninense]
MHPAPSTRHPPIAPAMTPLPPGTHHPSLPSSSSNSGNSTPVSSTPASDPKKKPPAKRKRTADCANDIPDSAAQPRTRDGPKKKKANRACFHCQKAHLTCDDCEYFLLLLSTPLLPLPLARAPPQSIRGAGCDAREPYRAVPPRTPDVAHGVIPSGP